MSKTKKILIALLIIFIAIQFIRPERNLGVADTTNDIEHAVAVSAEIKNILVSSCYDCHSNHTEYPWYFNIQPVAGWINHHIEEGKHKFNLSESKTFKTKRKLHKLEEMIEQIDTGEMPMSTYTLIHPNAVLSADQKNKLIAWTKESIATLKDTLKH
jgi:hypothetical protein